MVWCGVVFEEALMKFIAVYDFTISPLALFEPFSAEKKRIWNH